MSWGIRENTLDFFFSGPKQHSHLIVSEGMFIILIINSRPQLTGATCFSLLHVYVTPALPSKTARMELIWSLCLLTAH